MKSAQCKARLLRLPIQVSLSVLDISCKGGNKTKDDYVASDYFHGKPNAYKDSSLRVFFSEVHSIVLKRISILRNVSIKERRKLSHPYISAQINKKVTVQFVGVKVTDKQEKTFPNIQRCA